MADTQVAALDHTIQQTNIWLKTLAEELHIEDRHDAYRALRSVLHVLRDRLTPEQAVHLGAQLPVLVRGIYYDGWRIAGKPSDERQPVRFPPSPALSPKIEAVMQVDVGKERRNHRTLTRSPIIDRHDPIFEDAGFRSASTSKTDPSG